MSSTNEPETEELKTTLIESAVETVAQSNEELNTLTKITTIETYEAVVATIENNLDNIAIQSDEERGQPEQVVHGEEQIIESKADKPLAIFNTEDLNATGRAILNRLVQKFEGHICVAGKSSLNEVVNEINKSNVQFYELDPKSKESLVKFSAHIRETYGGINILINNYNLSDEKNTVSDVIEFNFRAISNLFNELFSLLRPHARIVNISSRRGLLRKCTDRRLRNKIASIEKLDDLNSVIDDFIKSIEANTIDDEGFPDSPFDMSKLALNLLTKIQQKNFDDSNCDLPGLISNSICPSDAEEKAIELAFLPQDYSGPKGCFYIGNDQVDWQTGYLLIQSFN